jgi:hypothetical protein
LYETTMRANQLCSWFASIPCSPCAAAPPTRPGEAGSIRLKLLKISAVTSSVRRIKIAMASIPESVGRRYHSTIRRG